MTYPLIIYALFRQTPRELQADQDIAPWGGPDRRLLVIVLTALALWLTDTLHGIAPAWIGLGAALVCLTPRIGVLPANSLVDDINYTPLIFLAGVIGLGAVATDSGLGGLLAAGLLDVVPLSPETHFTNFMAMWGMAVVVGVFTTMPAAPSILTPMAQAMADASGWSLIGVLMTQVGSWLMFPFHYQAPPLVLAVALANLPIGAVVRMLLSFLVVGAVILLPLHYLWGRWLGVFV